MRSPSVEVGEHFIDDCALEQLLFRVYVDAGFTDRAVAERALSAGAVRQRGDLLVATASDGARVGVVIVVPPGAEGRRIAASDEAEMHLLAVQPEHRGQGIGSRLIEAALVHARAKASAQMVLWTQPSMQSAQRLYLAHGFVRRPERDASLPNVPGRVFWVYERRF